MSGRFFGTFTPRLDDKGRVTLPSKYRHYFADGAMVVRGDSRCLYIFTMDGFDEFAEDAVNTSVDDLDRIGQSRYLMANSEDQTVDSQGRITLTSRMRDYAVLDRDVIVTGQGKRMEVWSPELWHSYEATQEPAYIDRSIRAVAPREHGTAAAPADGDRDGDGDRTEP